MSSYRQILYQLVFSPKSRRPVLSAPHQDELYKYIFGIAKNKNIKIFQINGVEDHIHILCDLHPSVALADFVKDIKVSTSGWIKQNQIFSNFENWAEGYGAFTYSIKDKERVMNYIKNQKKHHKKISFMDEYRALLLEHGIEFDEKFWF